MGVYIVFNLLKKCRIRKMVYQIIFVDVPYLINVFFNGIAHNTLPSFGQDFTVSMYNSQKNSVCSLSLQPLVT